VGSELSGNSGEFEGPAMTSKRDEVREFLKRQIYEVVMLSETGIWPSQDAVERGMGER
jgi:hypothetical protein